MNQLEEWGWSAALAARYQPELRDGMVPARVIEEQRDAYTVVADTGTCRAHAAGRLRHEALGKEGLPAVGDNTSPLAASPLRLADIGRRLPMQGNYLGRQCNRC